MIGIVASRLVDFYNRPTVVVSFGEEYCQGSARSVPGFNLYEAIRDCSEGLIGFGGHAAAAGLKLSESHFPTFAQRFEEHCRTTLTPEQREKTMTIDAEVLLSILSLSVVADIEKLEPHGIGNPRPLLLVCRSAGRRRAASGGPAEEPPSTASGPGQRSVQGHRLEHGRESQGPATWRNVLDRSITRRSTNGTAAATFSSSSAIWC